MSNLIFITAALIVTCNADNLTCYHNTKELVAFSKATIEQFNLNAAVFFNGLAKCRLPKGLLSNNVQVQMVNDKIGEKNWQKLALSLKFAKFGAFFQPKSITEAISVIQKVTPILSNFDLISDKNGYFQVARLDISLPKSNFWFFWMESVYERDANLSTNSLLGHVTFSPKANVLLVEGSRLTLNYDLFKVFDQDVIKVGHWKNSSLEILEYPRINTESSKIDLMGAQIRISAVNVSLW